MSTEQDQTSPHEGDAARPVQQQEQQQQQQQQRQPQGEGHAGQGSDSAMKQMRIWEQRRASNSGGNSRQGPD